MISEERKAVLLEALRGHSVAKENITEEYKKNLLLCDREEFTIETAGGPLKLYVFKAKNRTENCPVHINIHGGGFVRPHVIRDEVWSCKVADALKGIAVDLDYSLAPEYPYPTAVNQCYDATKWVFSKAEEWKADKEQISIGGYSAGANLAAVVSIKSNETKDFKLCYQVLGYGCFDMVTDPADKPDADKNLIPVERGRMFNECYTENDPEKLASPYCSPVKASFEQIKGVPEALVITAGSDNFRFEDGDYAVKLMLSGVKVTMKCFLNSSHGFIIHCTGEWEEAQQLIIDSLKAKAGIK
ncbi:MAG: alpha/beta hydrolase [Oribacterium sp.]|nr:alpha/beta hydrolase [Oribacterium sp.]